MQINFCLPIIKNDKQDVLKIINKNKNNFQYLEVWLDYVSNLDEIFLKDLQKLLGEKLIVVLRRQNLEKPHMSMDFKKDIIYLMHNSKSFLDLDIFDQKEELLFIRSNNLSIKTIISYHSYQETPSNISLKKIVDTMKKYKPAILKIATLCKSKRDATRLLQLLIELKEQQISCIVLGMGKHGLITRIFGSLWGNEMIFAPKIISDSSAPGQLTKSQLDTIFKQLEG